MSSTTLIEARPDPKPVQNPVEFPLIDGVGRRVDYLRLSVTDRCDLRCTYCMSKRMQFLPKSEVLNFAELYHLANIFIGRGVRKIRLTGGEPLVRRDVISLIEALGKHLQAGTLDELTLTTNGTRLSKYADRLAAAGLKRINVSLDHLSAEKYAALTRGGDILRVLEGISTAKTAGLHVKVNMVAIKNETFGHVETMMRWAHGEGHDLTVIEAMPLGDSGADRLASFADLRTLKQDLQSRFTLSVSTHRTSGPARYYDVKETGGRIGFISPLSNQFCDSCNRVRLTCTGQLYTCLGHEGAADLRSILREGGDLDSVINAALKAKPKSHNFDVERPDALATLRHMSVTGG